MCKSIYHLENEGWTEVLELLQVCQLELEGGKGMAYSCQAEPGLEVAYLELNGAYYIPKVHKNRNQYEINICIEGRSECHMQDGCFQYIGAGDIFLNNMENHSGRIAMPTGIYRGIVITVDSEQYRSEEENRADLPQYNIMEIMAPFFHDSTCEHCFFIQGNQETLHMFGLAGTLKSADLAAYLKLKAYEVMIYLKTIDPKAEKQLRTYTRELVDVVKQIERDITGNLSHRYTVEALSELYGVSVTAIKTNFKGVFGIPLRDYMINKRMDAAVEMLKNTDLSVGAISHQVGYGNQTKFSAAFKGYTGHNPLEYRRLFEKLEK